MAEFVARNQPKQLEAVVSIGSSPIYPTKPLKEFVKMGFNLGQVYFFSMFLMVVP